MYPAINVPCLKIRPPNLEVKELENHREKAPRMDDVSTASHMTKISSRGPRLRIWLRESLNEAGGLGLGTIKGVVWIYTLLKTNMTAENHLFL